MQIDMQKVGKAAVLAGALNGRRVLVTLLAAAETEPQSAELIFLDFGRINVATASFLRESVLTFRDIVRGRRSNFYPVIANANDAVRDELLELAKFCGGTLMTCTLANDGQVSEATLIGHLDPKQQVTFDLVRERGETDAAELMRNYGEKEGVKQTAWNNRLAALAALGLVVEISQGRTKRYRPLLEGV